MTSPIAARRVGYRHVLTPAARFDGPWLSGLFDAYFAAIEQGAQQVWLDLTGVAGRRGPAVDGVRRLAAFDREVRGRTVVICPPGPLRATLEGAGIADDLEVFDSLSDAQRSG